MTATITFARPIEGPAYDKNRPETKQAWLDFRRPGITATMIRDWGTASKRRKIIEEKVTGQFEDLSDNAYVNHGNIREPVIAEWVRGRFGIEPCDSVFAHPENSRHLASPDGVSLDPFTRELVVGDIGAVLAEIKTSKHDLTPGVIDDARVLVEIAQGSPFDRANYYTQMQWQMYVMNAAMTLFVYEMHDGQVDPETGTFTPVGPPEYVWVPRDQELIDVLVNDLAPRALAEIDRALSIGADQLPPASEFPAEDAILVADLLAARDAEAAAVAKKGQAWDALTNKYVRDEVADFSVDIGIAKVTLSTSTAPDKTVTEQVFDEEAWAKRAPKQYAAYLAAREKFTKPVKKVVPGKTSRRLTVTAKGAK